MNLEITWRNLLPLSTHSYIQFFFKKFSLEDALPVCECVFCNDSVCYRMQRNSYLFSLALCLKSSMAFMNRVTLNSPLSLSSNSRLEEKRGPCYTAVKLLIKPKVYKETNCTKHADTCYQCSSDIIISSTDDITYLEDRGTTISASVSYVFCQSAYPVLKQQRSIMLASQLSVFLHSVRYIGTLAKLPTCSSRGVILTLVPLQAA